MDTSQLSDLVEKAKELIVLNQYLKAKLKVKKEIATINRRTIKELLTRVKELQEQLDAKHSRQKLKSDVQKTLAMCSQSKAHYGEFWTESVPLMTKLF